ncbi:hypothetical protein HID58_014675 [Brassica napus]|uniref:Uncharacterized protein n=1 Tax=Brassica napus TaxID=3708 RepID=A0ABQ8DHY8_BRANA|nr:hypothetical protein HID58_014675 [Brassica napus]
MASQQVVHACPAMIQPSLWLGFRLRCHVRRSYLNSADEFRTREIAIAVGAKIHGSGAAEETAVVRTETPRSSPLLQLPSSLSHPIYFVFSVTAIHPINHLSIPKAYFEEPEAMAMNSVVQGFVINENNPLSASLTTLCRPRLNGTAFPLIRSDSDVAGHLRLIDGQHFPILQTFKLKELAENQSNGALISSTEVTKVETFTGDILA